MTTEFDLVTNIPGQNLTQELSLDKLLQKDGSFIPKLRDALVELFIDYEMLERDESNEYHENTINALTLAARDARSSTIHVQGGQSKKRLKIFPGEKNQDEVEAFLGKLMKTKDVITVSLDFKHVTLRSYFSVNKVTQGTTNVNTHGSKVTTSPPAIPPSVTLQLPQLNQKEFCKADSIKLLGDNLSAIKEWHAQLYTHAYSNGVYLPQWEDYDRGVIMGKRYTKAHVGTAAHAARDEMEKLIHAVLMNPNVIPVHLNLRDLIITAKSNGYQALYNILVRHHPALTIKNRIQTTYPHQGINDTFASHVKQVQQYIETEETYGRMYSKQDAAALCIKTLAPKYRSSFMKKAEEDLINKDPNYVIPFALDLCTIASTFEEWAFELGITYDVTSKQSQGGIINNNATQSEYGEYAHIVEEQVDNNHGLSEDMLDMLVDGYVNRIAQDPSAPRCKACGLPHATEDCHKLINVALAQRLLKRQPEIERKIIAKHKDFPKSNRFQRDCRQQYKNQAPMSTARKVHNLLENMKKLDLSEQEKVDENNESETQNDISDHMGIIKDGDNDTDDDADTFTPDQITLLQDEEQYQYITDEDILYLEHCLEEEGIRSLRPSTGRINMLSMHHLSQIDYTSEDELYEVTFDNDNCMNETQIHKIMKNRGESYNRECQMLKHSRLYQVDSGSAATTSKDTRCVQDYNKYPDNKRPTLVSASHHIIQSVGHGVVAGTCMGNVKEQFFTRVTPGINHNIISPGQHLDSHRNKYWGYMIGVDARDGSSVLVFKGGNSHGSDKYNLTNEDTIMKGIYKNRFQYVNIPMVTHMLNTNTKPIHALQMDTISLQQQLVHNISQDINMGLQHESFRSLQHYEALEQCSLLLVNSLQDRIMPDIISDIACESQQVFIAQLGAQLGQGITEYLNDYEDRQYTSEEMDIISSNFAAPISYLTAAVRKTLWHFRTGHRHDRHLTALSNVVKGIPKLSQHMEIDKCTSCYMAKLRKSARGTKNIERPKHPFQGLFADPGHMYMKSKNEEQMMAVESDNGHNAYFLFYCVSTEVLAGPTTNGKSPPLLWIHLFLSRVRPQAKDCWIRMDQGGETTRHPELMNLLAKHRYQVEQTGTDASSQINGVERGHGTIGSALRAMHYGANVPIKKWTFSFYEYIRLHNLYPMTQDDKQSRLTAATGIVYDISNIVAWGCHVYVRPPERRSSRLMINTRHGVYLGPAVTNDNFWYWNVSQDTILHAKHGSFDELRYGPTNDSPNTRMIFEKMGQMPPPDRTNFTSPLTNTEIFTTKSPFKMIYEIDIPKVCNDQLRGMVIKDAIQSLRNLVIRCTPGSSITNATDWKKLLHSTILTVNGVPVYSTAEVLQQFCLAENDGMKYTTIMFAPVDKAKSYQFLNHLPQLEMDQLRTITRHVYNIEAGEDERLDPYVEDEDVDYDCDLLPQEVLRIVQNDTGLAMEPTTSCKKVQQRPDWDKFKKAEHKQLDKHFEMNVFGRILPRNKLPTNATVCHQIWNYYIKPHTGEYKARDCINGKQLTRMGTVYTNTFNICVNWMPVALMFFAVCAVRNYIIEIHDVVNAFMESATPRKNMFVVVDPPMSEYFKEVKGMDVPVGHVIETKKAIQGDPEAGRKFDEEVDARYSKPLQAKRSVVEPSWLTHHDSNGNVIGMTLRQVDDFAVASDVQSHLDQVKQILDSNFKQVKHEGLMEKYMGANIHQHREYIKVLAEDYLKQMLRGHGLLERKPNEKTDPKEPLHPSMIRQLMEKKGSSDAKEQAALATKHGFRYRVVIGELIFVMTLCRFDITTAVTILAFFSQWPTNLHYIASVRVMKYLRGTITRGLIFWRLKPLESLPPGPLSYLRNKSPTPQLPYPEYPLDLGTYFDSSHAPFALLERRSIGGLMGLLAGTSVYAKTMKLPTITISATESEFVTGVFAGKFQKYGRSLLKSVYIKQKGGPGQCYGDNEAAERLTNHSKPTGRSRHVDIQYYAVQEWVKDKHIIMRRVASQYNMADALTKILGWVLHKRHCDEAMGYNGPRYWGRQE